MQEIIRNKIRPIIVELVEEFRNNPAIDNELAEILNHIAQIRGVKLNDPKFDEDLRIITSSNGKEVTISCEFKDTNQIPGHKDDKHLFQTTLSLKDEDFVIIKSSEGILVNDEQKGLALLNTEYKAKYIDEKGMLMSDSIYRDYYPYSIDYVRNLELKDLVLSELHEPALGYDKYFKLPVNIGKASYVNVSRSYNDLSTAKRTVITGIKKGGQYDNKTQSEVPAQVEEKQETGPKF